MRRSLASAFVAPVLLLAASAGPAGAASSAEIAPAVEPCALLSAVDLGAVQGEALVDARPSRRRSGPLLRLGCFYTLPTFAKSVSVELTTSDSAGGSRAAARDFWRESFHGQGAREEPERATEKASERAGAEGPAVPVKGLGEEAFWVGNHVIGALYVLCGDVVLRIGVGGAETIEAKIERGRALARSALERLGCTAAAPNALTRR